MNFVHRIKVTLAILCLLSLSCAKAQDLENWYKNWKNPANSDSMRLSNLDNIVFELAYSNPDSALKLAEIEKMEAKKFTAPQFYASAFYNIAVAHKSKGNSVKGIESIRTAIKEFTKNKDDLRVANSYNILGSLFDLQGDFERTIEAYLTSISIKEKLGDKRGMANSYNNVANIISKTGDYAKAIEYYEKSIALRKEINDDMGLAKGINNLGSVYVQTGEYEKALKLFRQSIDLRKKAGKEKSVINVIENMCELFIKLNMRDSAMHYSQIYLGMAQKQADVKTEASALINLARVHILNKKYTEAEKLLLGASKKIEGKNIMFVEQELHECMFDLYTQLKRYDLALAEHVKFVSIRDSIHSDEKKGSLIQQQMRFEFEKKEAEAKAMQARKDGEVAAKLESQKKVIIMIISAGSLVLLLLVMAIYAYRNSRRANKKIEKQNEVILHQKHVVEEKQKEIYDSINYAKRIQYTLLAHADFLKQHLPEHFVYFNPKDIVSGDFYWATSVGSGADERFYLAVCDSTGHGVPGAFMSLLNISFLSEAINEKGIREPNKVFDFVRQRLIDNISKEGQKDGFDGILLCFEKNVTLSRRAELAEAGVEGSYARITYAAANNAPVLVRKKPDTESIEVPVVELIEAPVAEFVEAPADRMPVGVGERQENFNLYTIDAKQGDMLYLYTDGYADQFGGPKGKKYMYKRLNTLLQELSAKTMEEQHQALSENFVNWKGQLEQVDDVCIIGVRL